VNLLPHEALNPIPGWEGIYSASSTGMIYSVERMDSAGRKCGGKFLSSVQNKSGRLFVVLCKNSYCKPFEVHRLVAMAFLPMIEGKDHVNHKNGDHQDNSPENLEWCTRQENNEHAVANGLTRGGKSKYRGVSYLSSGVRMNKWMVRVVVKGKQKFIGYFYSEAEAAHSFNEFVIANGLPNKINEVNL
jgi:HNH endonuclease/NUMOD4 motif